MLARRQRVIRVVFAPAVLLLVPLIAGLFTEAQWDLADYVVAAALLVGGGLTYAALASRVRSVPRRVIVAFSVGFVVALVWAELAVGLVGD